MALVRTVAVVAAGLLIVAALAMLVLTPVESATPGDDAEDCGVLLKVLITRGAVDRSGGEQSLEWIEQPGCVDAAAGPGVVAGTMLGVGVTLLAVAALSRRLGRSARPH